MFFLRNIYVTMIVKVNSLAHLSTLTITDQQTHTKILNSKLQLSKKCTSWWGRLCRKTAPNHLTLDCTLYKHCEKEIRLRWSINGQQTSMTAWLYGGSNRMSLTPPPSSPHATAQVRRRDLWGHNVVLGDCGQDDDLYVWLPPDSRLKCKGCLTAALILAKNTLNLKVRGWIKSPYKKTPWASLTSVVVCLLWGWCKGVQAIEDKPMDV